MKTQKILVMTAIEHTKAMMPKYNPYATGHGAHGDKKYNRAKEKRRFKKEIY